MNNTLISVLPRQRDSVLILSLTGVIDGYNANDFQRETQRWIGKKANKVVLECSGVNYMSSLGIGMVMSLHKALSVAGGHLVVAGLQARVLEVFSLLGFTSLLDIADEEAIAIDRLNNPTQAFPKVIECVICRKHLTARKSGTFRCPCCRTILAVDQRAQVRLR